MRRAAVHARLLLRTRLSALRNRLFSEAGLGPGVLVISTIALLGGTTFFGHVAAPTLLVPPEEIAAGGAFGGSAELPAGTAALEAAFWLTALASAVTSFRVMEILFRRSDLRAVDPFPIELSALYLDRLLAALFEAVAVAVVLSAFFVPLIWHGAPRVGWICMLVVATGLVASSIVSIAIQLAAGQINARSAAGGGQRNLGGAYGGPGQIFVFSPGIALAVCAIIVLLARLAAGELLAGGESLRGFVFGFGVIGFVVAASLVDSWRRFVDNFPTVAARFREADAVQYEAHLDYQSSAYRESIWYENLLSRSARPALRAAALQYGRAYMLTRYSYVIGWVLAGFALSQWSRTAFPPWAVVCAPALLAATIANPWQRLVKPPLQPTFASYLPIREESNASAILTISARELLLMTLPYAALIVWIDWGSVSAASLALRAGLAVMLPIALNGLMAGYWHLRRPHAVNATVLPVAAIAVAISVAIVSLPVLATVTATAIALHMLQLQAQSR